VSGGSGAATLTVNTDSQATPTGSINFSVIGMGQQGGGWVENQTSATLDVEQQFHYFRSLTIDHTKVPNTDQTGFPVLVSLTDSSLATTSNGGHVQSVSGYDIAFAADSQGATPLNYEIEDYNPATGQINAWVRIPTLSHTADTTIYILYGKPGVTGPQNSPNAVWDTSYKSVWHFANGLTLSTADSSANGANLTDYFGAAVGGAIGGAINFNLAPGAYATASLNGTGNSQMTAEAWIRSGATPSGQVGVLQWARSGQLTDQSPFLLWRYDNSNNLSIDFDGSYHFTSHLAAATWYHVAATWNSSHVLTLYINGVSQGTYQAASPPANLANANNLYLGTGYNGFWNGRMDEVRISNAARSADWIATEYNNQVSPAAFYSLGGETSYGTTTIYTISGRVTLAGNGLGGVTLALTGAATGTAATDTSGNYTFTGLAPGSYTVTPSLTGCTFSPTGTQVIVSTANQTASFTATGTPPAASSLTITSTHTGTFTQGQTGAVYALPSLTGHPALPRRAPSPSRSYRLPASSRSPSRAPAGPAPAPPARVAMSWRRT
jgi:hypothetical protein